ncbi:MAG: DUF1932 domain-containing protein [Acidimicrobiales bacterium]
MTLATVGVVHPGAMGASVGDHLTDAGHRVIWASGGRSAETNSRAEAAGLIDVGSLAALVDHGDFIVSVCPPHAALQTATDIAKHGFSGIYLDANAIAPSAAEAISGIVTEAGASFVDGGIVGLPPVETGTTRLFLSGGDSERVAELFEETLFDVVVIDDRVGSASALKTAFATWTKVSSALLLSVEAYADRTGVLPVLLEEWDRRFPHLGDRVELTRAATGPKAWRFVGEMEQLATAMADQDMPQGFHDAAGEIYQRLAAQNLPSAT